MKKGEIWLVELTEATGHEQKGMRPALILGRANGLAVVAPLTTSMERLNLEYTHPLEPTPDNGLTQPSVALLFQIRALDEGRFRKKIGWIPTDVRGIIDALLKSLLKID